MNGRVITSLFLLLSSSAVLATIPAAYREIAKAKGIPPTLFFAMALTESGYHYPISTHHKTDYLPWPWSLNIEGKPLRFSNRFAALRRLRQAVANGQSVDGGLLQINWHWHAHRFKYLDDLLDPYKNLAASADILVEQFRKTGSWWLACGRYHAPGTDRDSLQRAQRYRQRVRKQLIRLHQQIQQNSVEAL